MSSFNSSNNNKELIPIKSKDKFENLKNDYFLIKLFNNLPKKKKLEIIKYNKNIQKRINITLNDYKDYSETYTKIEIELIPSKNEDGLFIYYFDYEENKKYCHIYFNNNKEEINRNYLNKDDNITNIKIILDYQIESLSFLFYNCQCIESISFRIFYRKNITNMSSMFEWCLSLKEINFSSFNTSNVTHMYRMFHRCLELKELDLSNFNTNNVIIMNEMF